MQGDLPGLDAEQLTEGSDVESGKDEEEEHTAKSGFVKRNFGDIFWLWTPNSIDL